MCYNRCSAHPADSFHVLEFLHSSLSAGQAVRCAEGGNSCPQFLHQICIWRRKSAFSLLAVCAYILFSVCVSGMTKGAVVVYCYGCALNHCIAPEKSPVKGSYAAARCSCRCPGRRVRLSAFGSAADPVPCAPSRLRPRALDSSLFWCRGLGKGAAPVTLTVF